MVCQVLRLLFILKCSLHVDKKASLNNHYEVNKTKALLLFNKIGLKRSSYPQQHSRLS